MTISPTPDWSHHRELLSVLSFFIYLTASFAHCGIHSFFVFVIDILDLFTPSLYYFVYTTPSSLNSVV